MRNQRSIDSVR